MEKWHNEGKTCSMEIYSCKKKNTTKDEEYNFFCMFHGKEIQSNAP